MKHLIQKHLSTKSNLVFTIQQKVFIQNYITQHGSNMDRWERDFLIVLLNSETYSEQQKYTLEKIIKKK